MSAKGNFLILKRFRAGDEDLILKAYGTCGLTKVFVPSGLRVEKGLLGYTEPFNLISVVYKQLGNIIILQDLLRVEFLSYLTLESYKRYMWMSSLAIFVERWFLQYDPELFNMFLFYLSLNPENHEPFILKFKIDFLKRLGLYREDIFEERLRGFVKRLTKEQYIKNLERLRVSKGLLIKLDEAIEVHLSSSL